MKITIAAPAGADRNGNKGGEGGVSVFEVTMQQNEEFNFKIAGNYGSDFGGGGAGAYIYNKAAIMAVCGAGGGAGQSGKGGDGGGVGLAGADGSGNGAGEGGATVEDGAATVSGYFQGGSQLPTGAGNRNREGGKISGCTIGGYYRRLGVPPCSDVENGELTQEIELLQMEILLMDPDLLIEVIKQDLVIETMVELVMDLGVVALQVILEVMLHLIMVVEAEHLDIQMEGKEIISTQTGGNSGNGYFIIELADDD